MSFRQTKRRPRKNSSGGVCAFWRQTGLDKDAEFFFEAGHDGSHLFGFSHQKRINENVGLLRRHQFQFDHGLFDIAALFFTVVGNAHAFRIAECGSYNRTQRNRFQSFCLTAGDIGRDALNAVFTQNRNFGSEDLHVFKEALVEGCIPDVEVELAFVDGHGDGHVVAADLMSNLNDHLAVEVMREQMLEEFKNAAPGLEQFVRL